MSRRSIFMSYHKINYIDWYRIILFDELSKLPLIFQVSRWTSFSISKDTLDLNAFKIAIFYQQFFTLDISSNPRHNFIHVTLSFFSLHNQTRVGSVGRKYPSLFQQSSQTIFFFSMVQNCYSQWVADIYAANNMTDLILQEFLNFMSSFYYYL